ncbi:MAG: NAD-dependent epimerase/dehydratase family protein [Acidimicrobiales bacterium]
MRALVTGGSGFIGSHLVERLLREGHSVEVVDDFSSGSLANLAEARALHKDLRIHQADVRDLTVTELIERRQPEVVFHLAAQPNVVTSIADPGFDAEVNVVGSVRVIEGALRAGAKKVVYAASGGTLYGEARRAAEETQLYRPLSPYGVAKKVVIDYLFAYRERCDLEFTALALANVYGPRQRPDGEAGVVAKFASEVVAGTPSVIDGDGSQVRDFVYVDDAIDAFVRASSKGGGLVCNVGTGKGTTIKRLYSLMSDVAGSKVPPFFGPPRPGDLRASVLSPERSRLHLGWSPFTSLREGITATLADAAKISEGAKA